MLAKFWGFERLDLPVRFNVTVDNWAKILGVYQANQLTLMAGFCPSKKMLLNPIHLGHQYF
jgi:hypothetical protein